MFIFKIIKLLVLLLIAFIIYSVFSWQILKKQTFFSVGKNCKSKSAYIIIAHSITVKIDANSNKAIEQLFGSYCFK